MNKEDEQKLLQAVEGIRDVLLSMDGKISMMYNKINNIEKRIKD
jgi:hypothetical protein